MNKIYNKNLNIKSEKSDNKSNDILQLKEKNNDAETKMSKKMTNKEKLRKEAYLNDNNFLNYGDIKNKRLYDQYYQAINEDGYNEESEEVEEEQKSKKIKGRNKKNIKETNTNVISTREEMNVVEDIKEKKSGKKKKDKKIKNNYITNEDKSSNDDIEEEIKEVNDFNKRNKVNVKHLIHSLQISNENLRV